MHKDYKLKIKVQNNLLHIAMQAAGFRTASDLSKAAKIRKTTISNALNLRLSLYDKKGQVRTIYKKLSEFFRTLPEDLVPRQHYYSALAKNTASTEISYGDAQWLACKTPDLTLEGKDLSRHLWDAINKLPGRQPQVLEMLYFDKVPLNDCAKHFGLSRERIRQIEAVAIRNLRQPNVANKLREAI